MNFRYVCGAVTAVLLTWGAPTVARANPQTGSAEILPPDQEGMVTVAGCLTKGKGDTGIQFLLANPIPGPVESVPDGTCTPTIDARTLDLDKTHKGGVNGSFIGHWVEITGRLEREQHASVDNPRELSVKTFREVPVVPPQAAVALPEPAVVAEATPSQTPTPAVQTPPEETAVATTGTIPATLPQTASPLPGIGVLGLLAFAGGLALRVSRRRVRA